jgi:hypothetical protein
LNDSASVISIANTTLINDGSRKGLQEASISSLLAKSLVASSNETLDSWDCKTIHWRVIATTNRLAEILSACVVVEACNICVNTTNGVNTSIDGAIAKVIAVSSDIRDGSILASNSGIASDVLALVSSKAILCGILACSGSSITRRNEAHVAIVAILGGRHTLSRIEIAFVVHTLDGWASNSHAAVAIWNWGVLAWRSQVRVASVSCALVSIIAVDINTNASSGRLASRNVANVNNWASDIGVSASEHVIAGSSVALVAIRANNWGEDTAVSIDVGSAATSLASGLYAARWAYTSGSAGAKTSATSSARRCGEYLASSSNNSSKNRLKGGEGRNHRISRSSSIGQWGSKSIKLVLVYKRSNSDSKDKDSSSLGSSHNRREIVDLDVVHTVGKND